ncbi:hypothetical protein P5G50_17830 [Leifsonia sp. F6_8S_P_1B]|uniref:Uncharacterized protein n=1 Tax=Leifsonia williamsii TaxID=3035919 RepID=A0ABT8KH35_9MICO|nr:hypothetical protein [Leifsonia williamsii]MDN4616312.1 hypothetical protein [Leifsonia williamsii]
MREDGDGVFRAREPEQPLPYGLPDDPQEPYVAIVAPNLDKITARTFAPGTLGARRVRRGFVVLASVVAACVVIVGVAAVVLWAMSALG